MGCPQEGQATQEHLDSSFQSRPQPTGAGGASGAGGRLTVRSGDIYRLTDTYTSSGNRGPAGRELDRGAMVSITDTTTWKTFNLGPIS